MTVGQVVIIGSYAYLSNISNTEGLSGGGALYVLVCNAYTSTTSKNAVQLYFSTSGNIYSRIVGNGKTAWRLITSSSAT